ncbi:MAG: PDZ domain-containing protein, partial [Actinomycetota bacterium]|nr:PDZ domain-containing protein [Actinomycetota bacterium]
DDGPAQGGGLRTDDVIVAVGEREVPSMSALVIALREQAPGDRVDLAVLRNGQRELLSVELGIRPATDPKS